MVIVFAVLFATVALLNPFCCCGVTISHHRAPNRTLDALKKHADFLELQRLSSNVWELKQDAHLEDYFYLVAARDLEAGDVVLSVPTRFHWKLDYDQFPGLLVAVRSLPHKDMDSLATAYGVALAYLAYLQDETGKQQLPLALHGLPRTCVGRHDLAPDVIRAFPMNAYQYDGWGWENETEKLWHQLHDALPPSLRIVSLNDFMWALCVMDSRAFLDNFLAPVADMVAHSWDLENVHWVGSQERGLVFTAKRPLRQGDQIWMTYGCTTKLSMLLRYGFSPDGEEACNRVYVHQHLVLRLVDEQVEFDVSGLVRGSRIRVGHKHVKTPNTHEITVDAGEIVEFIDRNIHGDWAEVAASAGRIGWVPFSALLETFVPSEIPPPDELLSQLEAALRTYPPTATTHLHPQVRKARDANVHVIERAIEQLIERSRKEEL